jgi:adenosylmethionine-8-amino-7-oxononanoate aminotransferase
VAQVNTYGGHPVASPVALRNIEIMEAERLADRAAKMGANHGLRGVTDLKVVGNIRGKGLLIGAAPAAGALAPRSHCARHL